MARLLSLAFGMILALFVAANLLGRAQPMPAADAAVVSHSPWSNHPAPAPERNAFAQATVIARDGSGRFALAGAINGRAQELLVDTGADLVAIPQTQAAGLGIVVQPDQFRPVVRTASGTANAAPVRIDSLTVAGHDLHDVDGVVVEGLDRILLGQSALRRLGKVSIDGDRMEIGGN